MDHINIYNLLNIKQKNKNNGRSGGPLSINSLYQPKKKEKFSVDNIINIQEKIKKRVMKKYYEQYELCLDMIMEYTRLNKTNIIFSVPLFINEYPNYTPQKCTEYIKHRLKKHYIYAFIKSNTNIFISWKYIKENRKRKQEEINKNKRK
uniref:Uncharacterized protein n=1 Tax=Mimivirus LCMiAC01 TaxID=2506608 RepID=A0A481Z0P3_9VIRU|nr:MAG: uncharacterized protein LCMiAC01_00180 [Mimivirus LCMiAC01]